jgi:glycerate 2-kinase
MPPSSRGASAVPNSRSCAGAKPADAADPRRQLLLALLQVALRHVAGRRCVSAALAPPDPQAAPVWLAAVGKAATAMALGAHDVLGAHIERTLIVTRDPQGREQLPDHGALEFLLGGHPLPDARSLAAGARLLEWVRELPAGGQPLFLISGGSSSLVEVLAPGVTLAHLEALTRRAFAQGTSIGELNRERTALSLIKGGRLAAELNGRAARALFISDVPEDDPRVIGSGLMGAAAGGDLVERRIIASVDDAVAAVAATAASLGPSRHSGILLFDGPVTRLAARFAHELSLTAAQVCVWGGESTVELPPQPGRGGRNQHLALAVARLIAGHADLVLLAAGTDGSDGVTDDAGALIDAETCARLALAELDADRCLKEADSARALAASGDLVHTGPTGTNVGDLVIGLKISAAELHRLLAAHGEARARVL